ncbi:acyltransferase family protein [Mixta sp. Marseille-Q2659]|uniref:acyltransferase family protein n=1 Tax=Mixta sp. Marseille-Q2659 TaxID=2736607 RepID=UPI0023B95739|nr:acyltransferase family protein [Mixta sp. Marseille-Q2659]
MNHQATIKWRADIDGLRALAILLVVFFHAGIDSFSGGFIGVDAFFVVSGFLIGGIINKQINNGTFSFKDFYIRRIRRIAPALFFMMFVITALCYLILSPLEFRDLTKYGTFVFLSLPNVALLKGSDYFSVSADLNPLLMTWSLGIEEQFYFILPIILLLASRFKWSARRVIWLLTLLSLCASIVLTPLNVKTAFYLLHTRAWELGAGILLALYQPQPLSGKGANSLTLAGLLLLLLPAIMLEKDDVFPGWLALLPVLGAVLLLAARGSLSRWLLENAPMRYIGKISYSWYLWHWPLLSITRICSDHPLSVMQALSVCVLAFGIAAASYRWVEQPFRQPRASYRGVISGYCLLSSVAAVAFFSAYLMGGLKYRMNDLVNNGENYKINVQSNPCLLDYGASQPSTNKLCIPDASEPGVALLGDSHASALRSAVAQYALKNHKPLLQLTKASCPFLADVTRAVSDHPEHAQQCQQFNEAVMKIVLSSKVDEVVISAYWASGISLLPGFGYRDSAGKIRDNYQALNYGMEKTITRLQAAGKKITIVEDAPNLDIDPLRLHNNRNIPLRKELNQLLTRWNGLPAIGERTMLFHLPGDRIEKTLTAWRAHGVRVISVKEQLCSVSGCLISTGNQPVYYDANHLTELGSTVALGNNL